MNARKRVFWNLAVIFGILTVVFYFVSIKKLDPKAASVWGIEAVANIQATFFTVTSALLCGINVAGALFVGSLEDRDSKRDEQLFAEMAKLLKQNETIATSITKESEEKQKKEEHKQVDELKMKKVAGEDIDEYGWSVDAEDPNFVYCPRCKSRLSADYMKFRQVCPECGYVHKKLPQ